MPRGGSTILSYHGSLARFSRVSGRYMGIFSIEILRPGTSDHFFLSLRCTGLFRIPLSCKSRLSGILLPCFLRDRLSRRFLHARLFLLFRLFLWPGVVTSPGNLLPIPQD